MTSAPHQRSVDSYFHQAAGFWNDIYTARDVYALVHQERRERVLQWLGELPLDRGARVLEVGCGAGHTAVELAARGFAVEAIDGAPAMIEQTRERALQSGLTERLHATPGDVHRLHFPAASFDLVVALGVLPWLAEIETPLREMARVLKPGGFLIATMDNRWALHRVLEPRVTPLIMPLKSRLVRTLGRWGAIQPRTQAVTLPARGVDTAVRRAGLAKLRGVTLGFGPFTIGKFPLVSDERGARLHRRLQSLADRGVPFIRSGGGQYVFLAAK
jgi:ubiquinone/menaquinone biosynthesis C-methylase UbiE